MRVETLTPVVAAAPGERATCRLRIENTERGPLSYALTIVGFDEANMLPPLPSGPLAAGASEEIDIDFLVPDAFAAGDHSVAVQVTTDVAGAPPVIALVTVAVGSIDEVALAVQPSTIRGRRKGKFRVDIDNRSVDPIDIELAAAGPDLEVSVAPAHVRLYPGDRVHTDGRVKAPRRLFGEPRQHSLTVTARSRSAPSYAPATFIQRPWFPRSLRTLLAILTVLAVWLAALGAGFWWWTTRDDEEAEQATAPLVDTDGDGTPDTPGDQLVDTDGDGTPDTLASVVAEQVAAGMVGEPQPGGTDVPTTTIIGGTVKASDSGEDGDVTVTLMPRELGDPVPEGAALVGSVGEARGAVKLWPDRAIVDELSGLSSVRQTVSVETRESGPDGAWLFGNVAIRQTYELVLAKPGFDSQAFIVTPTPDGEPIDIEVELAPADGGLSGSVVGPNGPLGNVDLVLTDGTLTFQTTTASGAEGAGTWEFTGVSTPGTYTLTATREGFGTEVIQVPLAEGEQRTGVTISMVPGVGSITGHTWVGEDEEGGFTLTASNGETTLTTTSLTEGDRGLYSFPRLEIPGRYTVTASREGFLAQTRMVTVEGNATGVDFIMKATTGVIRGVVTSVKKNGDPRGRLGGATITVRRDDLAFSTTSSSSPGNRGEFTIEDVPPGEYVVEFTEFQHRDAKLLVSVVAGEPSDLHNVPLTFIGPPEEPNDGSLVVTVTDSKDDPLLGATVKLFAPKDLRREKAIHEIVDNEDSTFAFPLPGDELEVGTYQVEVSKDPDYNTVVRTVSIGQGEEELLVRLFKKGQVSGRVIHSIDRTTLGDYVLDLILLFPDGTDRRRFETELVPDEDTGGIRWQSRTDELIPGTYRVDLDVPPAGFRLTRQQVVQPGQPRMRFVIRADNDDPLTLNDLEVDPLPTLRGRVLAPRLDRATNAVTFAPLNDDGLHVTMDCPPTVPTPPVAEGQENRDGLPGFDFFEFSPEEVDRALGSVGTCDIRFRVEDSDDDDTEEDYVEKILQDVPIRASANPADRVRVFNVALFKPTDVGGSVYWLDRGATGRSQQFIPDVVITTDGVVFTGFAPGEGEATNPTPVPAEDDLTTTSGSGGRWAFTDPDKQVFGRATYEFAPPAPYDPRDIAIVIDEDDRTLEDLDSTGLELVNGAGEEIGVELEADGGQIVGEIELFTIKGTDDFPGSTANIAGFDLTVDRGPTPPGFQLVTGSSDPVTARSTYATFDPGTYTAAITRPDANHVLRAGQPRITGIVLFQRPSALAKEIDPIDEPADSPVSLTREFVERGQIDVTLLDADGDPLPDAEVDVTGRPRSGVDDEGEASFTGLPVDPDDPTGAPVAYDVTPVPGDGFDLSATTYTVDTEAEGLATFPPPDNDPTPDDISCPPALPPSTDCSTATLGIVAGGQQHVTFRVPRYGTIQGRAVGVVRESDTDQRPLPLRPLGRLTVTAEQVADETCTAIDGPAPTIEPDGDGFVLSGEPGFYTITVDHPAYEDEVLDMPDPVEPCSTTLGQDVYEMVNGFDNILADPWLLQAERGTLDLTVLQNTLAGAGVFEAVVGLRDLTEGIDVPLADDTTDGEGHLVVPELVAGNYRLEIRKQDAQGDLYFPVIVTVSIPEGETDAARTRVVRAPLPQIGGTIVGLVGAVNSEFDPVVVPEVDRVPIPAGIVVSRSYEPPDILVSDHTSVPGATSTFVPNQATESTLDLPVATTTSVAPGTTAPGTTAPGTTAPGTTAPGTTAPGTTAPGTTAPGTTAPPTTAPGPPRTRPLTSVPIPANPAGVPQQYRFENLATGTHDLSFSGGIDGYRAPAGFPQVVPLPAVVTVARQTYVAVDRTVQFNITPPLTTGESQTVTVDDPDPAGPVPVIGVDTDDDGIPDLWQISLPPELDEYSVTVERDLFLDETVDFTVSPGVGVQEVPVTLDPATARVRGTAFKRTGRGDGTVSPITTGGFAVLLADGVEVQSVPLVSADGGYLFDDLELPLAASYRVRIDLAEFASRSSDPFSPPVGQVTTVDRIEVPALARFSVRVFGPEPEDITVAVAQPASEDDVTPARSNRTFTFRVDPGNPPYPDAAFAYRFTASAPGFISQTVPATADSPNPSEIVPRIDVTLDERTISGRVTPAANNTRVELRDADGEPVDSATTNGAGDYTFTGVGPGEWTVVSERFGTGRGTSPVSITDATSPSVPGANVSLGARDVSVSFTTSPGGASVMFRRGTTVVSPASTTSPRVITENQWALVSGQLSLSWLATLADHLDETDTVTVGPGSGGSFDAPSFLVDIGEIELDPVPTTTPAPTTAPPTTAPPATTAPG